MSSFKTLNVNKLKLILRPSVMVILLVIVSTIACLNLNQALAMHGKSSPVLGKYFNLVYSGNLRKKTIQSTAQKLLEQHSQKLIKAGASSTEGLIQA